MVCIVQWADTWQNPFWDFMLFLFLFLFSISFYSSVLWWWPVRTMVGPHLFLILSNYENPQWLLIPWRMEFWFLKGPHTPGHRLSESVIFLVIPAPVPRTSCFWSLPTTLSPEVLCTQSLFLKCSLLPWPQYLHSDPLLHSIPLLLKDFLLREAYINTG